MKELQNKMKELNMKIGETNSKMKFLNEEIEEQIKNKENYVINELKMVELRENKKELESQVETLERAEEIILGIWR